MITHIFEKELAATNMTKREGLTHFILMQYLKSLGIEKHQAQGISGILRTEENITQMNWWIHDNRARGISREEIANRLLQIVGKGYTFTVKK